MGALHEGHLALFRKARQVATERGTVAVSLFVNPTQFNSSKDLATYPRTESEDKHLCRESGVDLVFEPSVKEMYPTECSVFVDEVALSRGLCGAARPGHFRGVCTVVTKLFHLFNPDSAVFGAKDFQQLAIIRRLVSELNFGVRVIEHPTLREKDGLAISSRNVRLNPVARSVAPGIYRALIRAKANSKKDLPKQVLKKLRRDLIKLPGLQLDYTACVHALTLEPVIDWSQPTVIAVAVFLGGVRLIDNIRVSKHRVA
jgi:pantoate--beta-alanine ligase